MQTEQTKKESKKDDQNEPSIKKMQKKELIEGPKVAEQTAKQANIINGQSSNNNDKQKESGKDEESSRNDKTALKHKAGSEPTVQQNTSQIVENIIDDDDVQIIAVNNPSSQNNSQHKKQDTVSSSNSKSKKKNTNRCKICKKGGSTSSFKPCKDCGRLFHYECIGMKKENDLQKKYFCDQCKDKQKQKRAVEREKEKKKKIKEKEKEKERQLKLETILAEAKKKFEKPKDKTKEETQRLLEEFQAKYPQYVENKKIKFPIEDTLLTIYDKTFIDTQNLPKRPYPQQSKVIPQEFMDDILMIWNFLNSFSEHLENMRFTKEQLYIALDHKGDESHALLSHIFRNLVRFPVLDIYFTHKIDNNKELSDQPFFILTRVVKELEKLDTIMPLIWTDFIKHLSYFQQYSLNFKDDEQLAEITQSMKKTDFSSFFDLNTQQRIKFMSLLIACVDDSDSFHDGVIGFRQEQVHEMTKERNDLQVEIKKEEGDFLVIDQKVKELEQTQKEQSASITDTLSRAEALKKQKELEKEKKELTKLKNQANKVEQQLNKKKNKCQQLTYDLPHYINTAQLLGYDHNKSEFWFFHNDRKTIYLRYKESIIDDDRVWCFYNTKEEIVNLIKSLNKKGIREKNLYDNLMYLVKNGYLQYKFEDFDKKVQANNQNGNQQKDQSGQGAQSILQLKNKNGTNNNENGNNTSEEKKEMEIEDNEQKETQQNEDVNKPQEEETQIEETKESILSYISNYDAQAVANKTTGTVQKKKPTKGTQQNEKELTALERAKCTFQDIAMMILETEKNYTDYLERRKSRWANKKTRETFRERVKNTTDPQEILTLLEQLNEGFCAVDHMYIKENGKILENEEDQQKMEQENEEEEQSVCSEDESYLETGKGKNGKNSNEKQNAEKQVLNLEYFENHPMMRSKKLPMRIWGIYSEKCKKNWQNLPMINVMSAYLCSFIFCTLIQRFLQRKKEQQQYGQNQNAYFVSGEDKKNITSSNILNNNKRKLTNINELESYRYVDDGLRRSDRQRFRKPDLTEPSYDLEDFEEEEGQQELDDDDKNDDEEDEFIHKSHKNKKGKKQSRKDEDFEEEYEDNQELDDEEDENEESEEDAVDQEEDQEEVIKPAGKRVLKKQKDIKQKKKIKDDIEEMEYEEQEEEVKEKSNKVSNNNKSKQNKKQIKDEDSEEEEEFQFNKDKNKDEKKNDKKPIYKEESDEEEEEFNMSKNKTNKNTISKNKTTDNSKKQNWDDKCRVCGQLGEVLMCDTCPAVFHLKCIHLKSTPEGEWSCLECQQKLLKQRQTRSAAKKKMK